MRVDKKESIARQFMEISRATKRKTAYVKIAISDELCEKIMKSTHFVQLSPDGFPQVTNLEISYREYVAPDVTEVKKALYKEKPVAYRIAKRDGCIIYEAPLKTLGRVSFYVPEVEAEGFELNMESQLLIRWLKV